jgi:hypothetical protein
MMDVRRVALDNFGETAIKIGEPMATIEEALVPLYLHHRYQAEATTKVVAGQYYTYALRGDGQEPLRAVSAREQNEALEALMRTIAPSELTIPRSVIASIPPRPPLYGPHQELFRRQTGLVFDAISPATAAADATLSLLFQVERAARMVQQEALDPSLPGLGDVIERVRAGTFGVSPRGPYEAEVGRAVERVFVDNLMRLASDAPSSQVRAVATMKLQDLVEWMVGSEVAATDADRAHYMLLASDIVRFLDRPHEPVDPPGAPSAPPGSPIGDFGMSWAGDGWSAMPTLTCSWGQW